jgi:hypothetical protein
VLRKKSYLLMAMLCLVILLVGACQGEPTPATGQEVKDAAGARDAALSYLQERKAQGVPGVDTKWEEEDVTPPGLMGQAIREFTSDGWTVKVSYPIVSPEHIQYQVTVSGAQFGWHWQGTVKPDGSVKEVSPLTQMSKESSQTIAEEFVINSSTFAFDGIRDTLELTETLTARCPFCWSFVFEFDSRQAGYGNRTGMMLAQVITHHRAVIAIEQHEIKSAIMDDKWDMLTQAEIESQ